MWIGYYSPEIIQRRTAVLIHCTFINCNTISWSYRGQFNIDKKFHKTTTHMMVIKLTLWTSSSFCWNCTFSVNQSIKSSSLPRHFIENTYIFYFMGVNGKVCGWCRKNTIVLINILFVGILVYSEVYQGDAGWKNTISSCAIFSYCTIILATQLGGGIETDPSNSKEKTGSISEKTIHFIVYKNVIKRTSNYLLFHPPTWGVHFNGNGLEVDTGKQINVSAIQIVSC